MAKSLSERFWEKVDRSAGEDACWEWRAGRLEAGYGAFSVGSRTDGSRRQAHSNRIAWELANGPIPSGLFVCHSCDNPPCCNPKHLWLGTPTDNIADRDAKGRQARGDRSRPLRGSTSPRAKLNEKKVREMRSRHGSGVTIGDLAREYGVVRSLASEIIAGKRWRHVE